VFKVLLRERQPLIYARSMQIAEWQHIIIRQDYCIGTARKMSVDTEVSKSCCCLFSISCALYHYRCQHSFIC